MVTWPRRMASLCSSAAAAGDIDRVLGRVLDLDPRKVDPPAVGDGQAVEAGVGHRERRGHAGADPADMHVLAAVDLTPLQ